MGTVVCGCRWSVPARAGTMTIRPAVVSDARRLAELRFDFRAGLTAPAESREQFVDRCSRWMVRQIASGNWHAWVAERAGALVGQIWFHTIEKVPNPVGERDRHGYISNLYVVADARGGTGTRLLEAVLEYASSQRIDRILLWPTSGSRTLYLRYGFTSAGDVFERTL